MLHIIAGERRGARLQTPEGETTRPTLGRVRASLFMILMPRLRDAIVLDLFAGCGALGLEALSRGARRVTFVESQRAALDALRANLERLRWPGRGEVVAGDALKFLGRPAPPAGSGPYSLVLLDPPYGQDLAPRALDRLAARAAAEADAGAEILATSGAEAGAQAQAGAKPARWLAPDAWVVAQVGRRDPLAEAYGPLRCFRREAYGQTRIEFYRLDGVT